MATWQLVRLLGAALLVGAILAAAWAAYGFVTLDVPSAIGALAGRRPAAQSSVHVGGAFELLTCGDREKVGPVHAGGTVSADEETALW